MSEFLRDFARRFAALDADNLQRLDELYSRDVVFHDPLHQISGLANVRQYFAELYANVRELRFDFHAFDQTGDSSGYLRWTMSYRHPRLARSAAMSCCRPAWCARPIFALCARWWALRCLPKMRSLPPTGPTRFAPCAMAAPS